MYCKPTLIFFFLFYTSGSACTCKVIKYSIKIKIKTICSMPRNVKDVSIRDFAIQFILCYLFS